jgi:zinc D-Ala-D-Ala dipeptidase
MMKFRDILKSIYHSILQVRIIYKFLFISHFLFVFLHGQNDTLIVPLASIDSTIIQDVRYATKNNFTGKVLYPSAKVYLRKIVAEKLAKANEYLKENYHLRIKIYDGYRPLFIQKLMWKIVPDDRFVANPAKGSKHNRGAAVDITLINKEGEELDMGTPYDDFTEKANYFYQELSSNIKANRKLLRETMTQFGFIPMDGEWWHFDSQGWSKFSIQDTEIN